MESNAKPSMSELKTDTIAQFHLTFRRMDCWLTTKLLRRRYEFILPGKIRR